MKPSNKHQYRVIDPVLDNIVMCVLSPQDMYLSPDNVETLSSINSLYRKMVHDVMRLKGMDFSKLREARKGYAMQQEIQQSRIDLLGNSGNDSLFFAPRNANMIHQRQICRRK
jgi:hypothetical protein